MSHGRGIGSGCSPIGPSPGRFYEKTHAGQFGRRFNAGRLEQASSPVRGLGDRAQTSVTKARQSAVEASYEEEAGRGLRPGGS